MTMLPTSLPPEMDRAFEQGTPGRLVRMLHGHSGMRRTGEQIADHASFWRELAAEAWRSEVPPLVVLGDSLSQGIGAADPRSSYAFRVWEQMWPSEQPAIINLSRSGARLEDVLTTQLPARRTIGDRPRATLCTVGSNDLLRSIRLGRHNKRLEELIDALDDDAVLATLPARGSIMASLLNRRLRSRAATVGLDVADVAVGLTSWRGRRSPDGFHPNEVGYEVWTAAFVEALRSEGYEAR